MYEIKRDGVDQNSKHHCAKCNRYCYCYVYYYSSTSSTYWSLKPQYFCYLCYNEVFKQGPTFTEKIKDFLGIKTYWRERIEDNKLVEIPMIITYKGKRSIEKMIMTNKKAIEYKTGKEIVRNSN